MRLESQVTDLPANKNLSTLIQAVAGQLLLKVSAGDIATELNMTPQSMLLSSRLIQLKGDVSLSQIDEDVENITFIHGGNIKAKTVTVEQISVEELAALEATIAGFALENGSIHTKGKDVEDGSSTSLALSSSGFSRTIAGESRDDLMFAIANGFGVSKAGKAYMTGAEVQGKIQAASGKIGDWLISDRGLKYGDIGSPGSIFLIPDGNLSTIAEVAGVKKKDWRITVGDTFGVDSDGSLYSQDATLEGTIVAVAGSIGGWSINEDMLSYGAIGKPDSIFLIPSGNLDEDVSIGGERWSDWRLTVGNKFGVDSYGNLRCKDAVLDNFRTTNSVSISEKYFSQNKFDHIVIVNFNMTDADRINGSYLDYPPIQHMVVPVLAKVSGGNGSTYHNAYVDVLGEASGQSAGFMYLYSADGTSIDWTRADIYGFCAYFTNEE